MDDTAINLENILEQAPRWNFAGDFTLLQWMKQISQDMESRATKTTEALSKLHNSVRSTNIALDNVANSLTTLQFGNQFVECRVQDDDETLINGNNACRDNQKQTDENTTSKDMLNTFLDNNLKALRNCHEKYSIDLEDSDDDEKSEEKTCIYQPINPYNERPLPFIFGSKDWNSKWHVGLCENQEENSYSGDEISEAFSESSSTSHLDDESFESNTEWASSNSVDNDHLNSNIEIKNASSLRGSQPLYPVTSVPINAAKTKTAISESYSTADTSSSLAKKSLQTAKQNENLTQRSESINSISSKNSSKAAPKVSSFKETTSEYKTHPQTCVDLFAEPPEDLQSSTPSSVSSAQNIIRSPIDNRTISKERPSIYRTQPPPFVDLFAEPPEDIVSSTTSSMSSNQNIRRKTVNLFDEDEDNIAKDDLLSVFTKNEELEEPNSRENKNLPAAKSDITNESSIISKTFKPLFDDSDEDDFLKAFVRKSSSKDATETLLFHKENDETIVNSSLLKNDNNNANKASATGSTTGEKPSSKKIQNIFDTDDNDDLRFNKTIKDASKIPTQNRKTSASDLKVLDKPSVEENSVNLFNDFDDVPKKHILNSAKISKKINLFDDLDDDELFSAKPKKKDDIFSQTGNEKNRNSLSENKEESFENLKDATTTKDIGSIILISNQVANTSKLQSNNIHREEIDKSRESVRKDDTIVQTLVSEINENNVNTESFGNQKELHAGEKRFEQPNLDNYSFIQCQKELNENKSTTTTQDKSVPVAENVLQKPGSSNKYDFNSILFLDEPPDDDKDFFETLSKTPNTLNSSYNAIDLETDTYEPELPEVPVTSTSNNQTDTSENLYTGLQLFSDIPPDDDASGSDTSNITPYSNQTKRVHSVFYDDFKETLVALNQQHTEKEILNHSIFSEEPPPMNDERNSISGDIIDHKVPDNKQEVKYSDRKSENVGIAAIFKKTVYAADEENTNEFSNKRPVSKLQMPHINIDVQALLPVANSTLRKTKEDNRKSNAINSYYVDNKSALNVSKGLENVVAISKIHATEVPRTAETEHILPNLTKNRVKASAARRPSTRRARQENYRKSLIEQQQILESGDETSEIKNESDNKISKTIQTQTRANIPLTSPMQVKPNSAMEVQNFEDLINDVLRTHNPGIDSTASPTSALVEGKHQDNHNILSVANVDVLEIENDSDHSLREESSKYSQSSSLVQNIKSSTNSQELIKKVDHGTLNHFTQIKNISESNDKDEVKIKSKQTKGLLLFEDEEEDEDFFKCIKTSKIIDDNSTSKAKNSKENITSISALETSEVNALSSAHLLVNNINIGTTKEIRVPPSIQADISNAIVQSKTQEYEQQQPSKGDENLFNKSHARGIFEVKKSNPITANKSTSLLDGEDYDDDLFKTTLQQPTSFTTNSKKDRNQKAKSQFKSFLDSESDGEPTVAGLKTTTPIRSKIVSTTRTSIPHENAKLFAPSESDSDDLFTKSLSTKNSDNRISIEATTKKQTKVQSQSSFFGDSDSDDFIIPSSNISKSTVLKGALKKNVPKTTTNTNTSLFSDLDSDEDDLFGGGITRGKTTNVIPILNAKAPSTTKPSVSVAEISKLKRVDDNPLADLL